MMDDNCKEALQRIEANCKSLTVSIFKIPSEMNRPVRDSRRKSSREIPDVVACSKNSVRKVLERPELPKPKRSRRQALQKVTSEREANVTNDKEDGGEVTASDIPIVKTSVTDRAKESYASNHEESYELSKKNMEMPKEDLSCDDKPADAKLSACNSKVFDQGKMCVAIPIQNLQHIEKDMAGKSIFPLCFPVQPMTLLSVVDHHALGNTVLENSSDKETKEVSVPSALSKCSTSDSDNGERNNSSDCDVLKNDLPDKEVVQTDSEITKSDVIYMETVTKCSAKNQQPTKIRNRKISEGYHKFSSAKQTSFPSFYGSPSRVSQRKIEIELPNIPKPHETDIFKMCQVMAIAINCKMKVVWSQEFSSPTFSGSPSKVNRKTLEIELPNISLLPETNVFKIFEKLAIAHNCKMKVVWTQDSSVITQYANFNSSSTGRMAGSVVSKKISTSFQNQAATYSYSPRRHMLHTGKTVSSSSETGKLPLFDEELDLQNLKRRLEICGSQIEYSDVQHQLQIQSPAVEGRISTSFNENVENHKKKVINPSYDFPKKTKNAVAKEMKLDLENDTDPLCPEVILFCPAE